MKKIHRFICSFLFLALLPPAAGHAQSEDERDIVSKFQSGQATGMKVTILLAGANGSLTPVDPKREFSPGEEIKVALESNMRGYVYLVNFGSSGKNSVVFPNARAGESHLIQPYRQRIIPFTYAIGFDEHTGTESFRVFVSGRPVAFLEAAVRRRDGVLTEREAEAFAGLSSAGTRQQMGVVAAEMSFTDKPASSRTIGTRDPIWNDGKKTSLVVVRRRKGQGDRLQPGEIAVFGINFKNKGATK
jgi:hypothetical protein